MNQHKVGQLAKSNNQIDNLKTKAKYCSVISTELIPPSNPFVDHHSDSALKSICLAFITDNKYESNTKGVYAETLQATYNSAYVKPSLSKLNKGLLSSAIIVCVKKLLNIVSVLVIFLIIHQILIISNLISRK